VRWGTGIWSNLKSKKLFAAGDVPGCSPKHIEQGKVNFEIADLFKHPFLHDDPDQDVWRNWLRLVGIDRLPPHSCPIIVDPKVRIEAVIKGQGFALADSLVDEDLKAGRL
jgi:hypothetical protein